VIYNLHFTVIYLQLSRNGAIVNYDFVLSFFIPYVIEIFKGLDLKYNKPNNLGRNYLSLDSGLHDAHITPHKPIWDQRTLWLSW